MRDGMYRMVFQGPTDHGEGVPVFEAGRVWGTDSAEARYDGEYLMNPATEMADLKLKVNFPPGVRAVFGIANPYEWAIDVTTSLDPKQPKGELYVHTSVGPVLRAQYEFMRELPHAA